MTTFLSEIIIEKLLKTHNIYKIAQEMVSYCVDGTVSDTTILVAPYLVDASNAVKPE